MEVSFASRVLGVAFAIAALGGVLWFSQQSNDTPVQDPAAASSAAKTRPEDEPLPISESGPYPKVVIDEPVYDFGMMAVDTEQSHDFIIKNEGEAPLLLKKGKTTCKCTLSTVAGEPIPPGGQAVVTLEWKGTNLVYEFEQAANIWTNDPEKPSISLRVRGAVVQHIIVQPSEAWTVGNVPDDKPREITGRAISYTLDSFEITSIEQTDPVDWLSLSYEPLSEEDLKKLDKVKAGYKITAKIEPKMPIGPFSSRFRLHLQLPESKTIDVALNGSRPGPFEFHPVGGIGFDSEKMGISLGTFEAKAGKKGLLLMFVSGMGDEELQVLDITTLPDYLKVRVEPQTADRPDAKKKIYNFHVEVPPGLPPEARTRGNNGEAILKINHPQVKELKFKFAWTSR